MENERRFAISLSDTMYGYTASSYVLEHLTLAEAKAIVRRWEKPFIKAWKKGIDIPVSYVIEEWKQYSDGYGEYQYWHSEREVEYLMTCQW